MMNESIYTQIFETLVPLVPQGWHNIVFFMYIGQDTFSMQYYYNMGDEKYIQCFSGKTSRKLILDTFRQIHKLVNSARTPEDSWTNATIIYSSDGKFHADFDYSDFMEERDEYMKLWKIKYLT